MKHSCKIISYFSGRVCTLVVFSLLVSFIFPLTVSADTSRKERRLILQGNKTYTERKFVEAESIYAEALKENPSSAEARYNLGLSQVRQVTNVNDTSAKTAAKLDNARKNFAEVARLVKDKPGLAAKANYNLGNIEFNAKDYQKAIEYYKQALRIDSNDEHARKNLRIAQKQLQNQNQDKNQDKNQNQDKKENKEQQQNQNKEQQKPKDNEVSQQSAERIMQSIDNKENQTRARINRASKGDKSAGAATSRKKW